MSRKALIAYFYATMMTIDLGVGGSSIKQYNPKILPESSNDLPVIDVEEAPPNDSDPKEADLNPIRLRQKLGIAFQKDFMSIEEPDLDMYPQDSSPRFADNIRLRGRPSGKLPSWIRRIDLFDSIKSGRHSISINKKQKRKIQLWLWQTTHCPVIYKWKKLSHRFWPPWIKIGTCDNSRSCSLPAGMGCHPKEKMMITILRWHCQGISADNMQYCTWIPVKYPIISECKCKCKSNS